MTHQDSGLTSHIPPSGRVLGLDWGRNRIGVAITDETQLLATPLAVFRRRTGKRLPLGQFLSLVEGAHPVGMVVGLPVDDQGHLGEAAIDAREMGDLFATRSGLPIDWLDESFTTVEAEHRLAERGIAPRMRRHDVDAMAAAVLLERWIAKRRGES
jgi:putative Holliday junction resolvase